MIETSGRALIQIPPECYCSVSYSFLVSRYLMIPGLDMETRHKRLDKASAYLFFTAINPAEFVSGWSGLHPYNGVIGEEGQHVYPPL